MNPGVEIERLNTALAAADWPTAERALRRLLARDARNASLHYNLGLVRRRRGDAPGAAAALQAALALDPAHQNARFELATLRMETGQPDEAMALLEIYVAAAPRDGHGWLNLGRLRLRAGDAAGARAALEQAARHGADDALARAEADRDLGNVDAALARLAEAVARDQAIRPAALKVASQGARGRLSLDAARLYSPR